MKKYILPSLIFIILSSCVIFCYIKNNQLERKLSIRSYVLQESEDEIKPYVLLKGKNEFEFLYSALSNYKAIGKYKIKNNNLILYTYDNKYKYIFEIGDNTLIFKIKESDMLPEYANIEDGANFK